MGSEDRSIDLLDNPQEEVSIDALGTQREALVSKAEEEGMTSPGSSRKGCMQIGNTDLQGMLPPKLGLVHPAVICPALWLCTLTKASLRSAACVMFKGLETNSPRTGIVCLTKQSRRAWCCTWEKSGPVPCLPVQQSLAWDSHLSLS